MNCTKSAIVLVLNYIVCKNSDGCRTQNTEYRIQNTEYRIQNTEYRIQNTEYRIQNTEYRIQNTVNNKYHFEHKKSPL
jgi:division protein CdvB (Snf7/Vps24/ESCRT-III family)